MLREEKSIQTQIDRNASGSLRKQYCGRRQLQRLSGIRKAFRRGLSFQELPKSRKDRIGRVLMDFSYPPVCPVCEDILRAEEYPVCAACRKKLPVVREPLCAKCGAPVRSDTALLCGGCAAHPHVFDRGRAAFVYEKRLRRAVDKFKFHNRRCYADFFVGAMAQLAAQVFPRWKPVCLVPIPMHVRKRRERGFNQAVLLAERLGALTGVPVRSDLLVRIRYTKASKQLGRVARKRNLQGAFAVRPGVRLHGCIVLIDDIYTTGTTMDEAARALRAAGAEQVCFLTASIVRGEE